MLINPQNSDSMPAPSTISPCRASELLAGQADVDQLGIDLPLDQARVVLCALSHLLGKGKSKSRGQLHSTIDGVVQMVRIEVTRFGETTPAPHPDLTVEGWPSGRSAFHKLGITHVDLEEAWALGRDRADDACLPAEWILAFFPARLWPAIATLIGWGPDVLQIRMEKAVAAMAREKTTRMKRRRPAGSLLAKGTIEVRITGVWQLLDALIAVRTHVATAPNPSLDIAIIDAWTRKPKRINSAALGARESGQNNSGPSIEDCAKRLRELALEARTGHPQYLRQRRRLLLSLLCLYGVRADALRTLRVEDYIPTHRFSNGTTGPALRIFPGKSWHRDQPHHLPLAPHPATWIEQWITFTGREVGDIDQPLFPNRNPTTATTPVTYLGQANFYAAIAGNTKDKWGCRALLPTGEDPHIGWHPHAYRHTAYQLAIRAAIAYQKDHPDRYPHVHPEEFAKALLGHKLGGTVSATYRDLNREALSVAIVPYMWDVLYGDGALRRGPDPTRIHAAREHHDTLQTTIAALQADLANNEAAAQNLGKRAQASRDPQRQLALYAQATHISDTARGQRDALDHYQRDLGAARAELALAQETLVPLPDGLTDGDYQALLADALGTPTQTSPEAEPSILAEEITIPDAAEVWDTTPQAIRRWIRDGSPRGRPPTWADDAWHFYTKKDKRLRVARIHTQHLTRQQLQRLHHVQERRGRLDKRP